VAVLRMEFTGRRRCTPSTRFSTLEKNGLNAHVYWTSACRGCAMKARCTTSDYRGPCDASGWHTGAPKAFPTWCLKRHYVIVRSRRTYPITTLSATFNGELSHDRFDFPHVLSASMKRRSVTSG